MPPLSRAARLPVALFVLSLVIFSLRTLHLNREDILIDDAYISFRYAENLARGNGLVFNPGEPVEGYTNFLWTVLLAGCSWLGLDLISASKWLAFGAGAACLSLLHLFGWQLFINNHRQSGGDHPPTALFLSALPGLLFAAMPSQARYAVSGMETLLFTALVAAGVYLLLYHQRPAVTGLVFALAAMTRPEGLLYFALAAGYRWLFAPRPTQRMLASPINLRMRLISGWRELLVLAGSFALLYAPYFAWRFGYYGYLLPNTFYAKAAGFHMARLVRGWETLSWVTDAWTGLPFYVLALGALLSIRRERAWLLLSALTISTFAYFIYVGGDFVIWFGPRFFIPILPYLLLAVAESVRLLSAWLAGRLFSRTSSTKAISQFTIAGLAGISLLIVAMWFSWPARFSTMDWFRAQMRSWKELGIWMHDNLPHDATVAVDAAGLIPFYSGVYTIDMYGLADEYIAHIELDAPGSGTTAHEKFDPVYVLQRNPTCIVSSWVNPEGVPVAAGLTDHADEIFSRYRLRILTKVSGGPPEDGRWLIETNQVTIETHGAGYQTGLFCQP